MRHRSARTILAWIIIILVMRKTHPGLAQTTDLSFLKEAQTALEERRYSDAETLLNAAILDHPDSAETHYHLGLSLHQQFRLGEAIAAYQSAIQINPKYDLPYLNLGLAQIEMRRLEAAYLTFEQVLELPDQKGTLASHHTLAYYNLAVILSRQDKTDAALEKVQAALSVQPNFEPAQILRQRLLLPSSS